MIESTAVFWSAMVILWFSCYLAISDGLWKKTDPSFKAVEPAFLPSAIIGAAGGFVIMALVVMLFWATGLMNEWDIHFFWK
jgi:hypothetical protein